MTYLFSTDNTIVQAIYTEPPSNISTVPQNYTVHCLADCGTTVNITSENTLNTLISSLPNTTTSDQLQLCNYSVTVQWNPNVSYSGNPMWKCEAQRDNITESLQTYIRGKLVDMMLAMINIVYSSSYCSQRPDPKHQRHYIIMDTIEWSLWVRGICLHTNATVH